MFFSRSDQRVRQARFTPGCESLENRLVPAITWNIVGSELTISEATEGPDSFTIRDDGTNNPGNICIIIGDQAFCPVGEQAINKIVVRSGKQADTARYVLNGALAAGVQRDVQFYLGEGNDRFEGILGADSAGVSLYDNAGLRLIVWGTKGYDVLSTEVRGDLRGGSMLGLSMKGGGSSSGDLFDDIFVNATNDVDIASNATLWMNLWGNEGDDWFFIDYRGELDGRLLLHVEGGSEPDLMRVNLTLDAGSAGSVGDPNAPNDFQGNWNRYAVLYGDGDDDDLTFNIFNNGTAAVLAQIYGGTGNDTLNGTANVTKTQ
jgi:hypothetical protein